MPSFSNSFYELAAILTLAAGVGALAVRLRQPLIIAFIVVGIVVGPAGLGWVVSTDEVELFAKLGITLLLFVVGLKLDPHEIRAVGPIAIATALGQMTLTGGIGYIIGLVLGFSTIEAFYIATALTFSSTIIIVKLLSDQREIDSLHGRISVGVLIVQDITVIVVMIALTALTGEAGATNLGQTIVEVALKGAAFLGAIALFTRFGLGRLLHSVARSPELLVLAAITWTVALAAGADTLGL